MRSYLSTHIVIALLAVFCAVVFASAAWYITHTLSTVESLVEERVTANRATLTELAQVTDRNGADSVTERIIEDCPRRTEFESALENLNTATVKDLITAQQLFESCGSYFAERKALMVARLEREHEALSANMKLLAALRDLTEEERALTAWGELIDLEVKRSALLGEQTTIQGDIIRELIDNGRSTRVGDLVKEARNISESLIITDKQIDELRTTLIP